MYMSRCFFCLLHFHELYKISLHSNMVNMREHPSNLSGLISQFSDESKFIPRTALHSYLPDIHGSFLRIRWKQSIWGGRGKDDISKTLCKETSGRSANVQCTRKMYIKLRNTEIQMFLFFGLPLVLSLWYHINFCFHFIVDNFGVHFDIR